LCDAEREGRLARPRRPREQQRAPGHLFLADHVDDDAARLARLRLAHEARGHLVRGPVVAEAEPLDVRVRRDALRLGGRRDLLDAHRGGGWWGWWGW
jgi:hypothetical protein